MSNADQRPPAPPRSKLTAYLGHLINPIDWQSYEEFREGALLVDEAGIICGAGEWSRLRAGTRDIHTVVDFGKRLIMPGFVDLHIHLPQITITGKSGSTLLGWLEKYTYPAETRFADLDYAKKVASWFFDELSRNGTTCAVVMTTVHARATDAAFQIAADKGNRVIMGKMMMDYATPPGLLEDTGESLHGAEELCKKWHGQHDSRLRYAFTPRFGPTSTSALLSGTAKLWERYPGTYLHTHTSENIDEVKVVKERFPESRSYIDVYKSLGLMGRNSIYAHGIHLDDGDMAVLKATDSALAHCPSSNFFLKSGIFKFREIKSRKIKFGLGSDVGGGPEMSMFKVMKDAAYIQPQDWIHPAELFYLATLGGAKAANLADNIGSLTSGKEADFIVVDPSRKEAIADDVLQHDSDEILSQLTYLGDDRMIIATFVRGRLLYCREEYRAVSLVNS